MRKIRIAVLNSHPVQYFAPLYAYLNAEPDIEITALYLSDVGIRGGHDRDFGRNVKWDIDLLSGYPYVFVGDAAKRPEPGGGFFSMIAPQLWGVVRSGGYDALWLHGHGYCANIIALLAARSAGIPVLMRGETHLGLKRGAVKLAVRRFALGVLYGQCDRFLSIGSANEEFYRAMGVDERRVKRVPYAVDNDRFMQQSRLDAAQRSEVRASLGIHDDRPAALYASKFQRRKHPDVLVRACHVLAGEGLKFHLVLAGAGEMEQGLRTLVAELGLPDVHFPGFINQAALPKVYAACDAFVLPSENESFGLAVNEAMCAGLPIVAASEIGCVPDLVREGENGATFTATDVAGLASALRPIIADGALRTRMARRSAEIISEWGFAQCRDGLRAALEGLVHGGSRERRL